MLEPLSDGRVEVITGCMFAGKTDELIRRIARAGFQKKSTVVFKPATDNRNEGSKLFTHSGQEIEARTIDPNDMDSIREHIGHTDVVGIDEVNFFSESLIQVADELADNGVRVILAGLDQTFRGEPFEPMDMAMAMSDSLTKLTAVCVKCGNQATRNQRFIEGHPAPYEAQTIHVGGGDSYEARCRHCHEVPTE